MTSQPGMTSHHDQAIELNVIETVSEDNEMAASRPPQICINLSPSLSRQNTADTIDTDCPENQSPRRIFTEFSSGTEAEAYSKDNQSNILLNDGAYLTPTIQKRGISRQLFAFIKMAKSFVGLFMQIFVQNQILIYAKIKGFLKQIRGAGVIKD